jgi:hypothetical protein
VNLLGLLVLFWLRKMVRNSGAAPHPNASEASLNSNEDTRDETRMSGRFLGVV